jgi:hypothetical protein
MLFYGRVSLAINGVVMQALLRAWGHNGLLALLQEEFVALIGVEKQPVVINFKQGTSEEYYSQVLPPYARARPGDREQGTPLQPGM